jgi:hypothetical protein
VGANRVAAEHHGGATAIRDDAHAEPQNERVGEHARVMRRDEMPAVCGIDAEQCGRLAATLVHDGQELTLPHRKGHDGAGLDPKTMLRGQTQCRMLQQQH